MKKLIACLCLLAFCANVSGAEPWKTTVIKVAITDSNGVATFPGVPAKKGYDCGCHGQGNCVCGPGCACVPYLTMTKKKADCGCAITGECSCAPGTCACPSCAKTVKTELDEYAAAYNKAVSEGKPLVVCVGFCRRDIKTMPGVVGCCAVDDQRFANVTPGTLMVYRNEGGKLPLVASLPGNAAVEQVRAALVPPVQQVYQPQMAYQTMQPFFGGFGGGFGGGGGCRGGG